MCQHIYLNGQVIAYLRSKLCINITQGKCLSMTAGASTVPEETIKAEEAKFPQDRILEFPRTDSNGSRLKFPTNTREERTYVKMVES